MTAADPFDPAPPGPVAADPPSRFKKRRVDDDDDDDDRPSRRRRDDDEDDRPGRRGRDRSTGRGGDDDPPRRRTRNADDDDDEDDDDAPRLKRAKKKAGASPLLIVGLVAGGLFLLSCCGVGGYFAVQGGLGNDVTITSAQRQPGRGFIRDAVKVQYRASASARPTGSYKAVARCNGVTTAPQPIPAVPGTEGSFLFPAAEITGQVGPVEVWVEESGKKVSNTYTIP